MASKRGIKEDTHSTSPIGNNRPLSTEHYGFFPPCSHTFPRDDGHGGYGHAKRFPFHYIPSIPVYGYFGQLGQQWTTQNGKRKGSARNVPLCVHIRISCAFHSSLVRRLRSNYLPVRNECVSIEIGGRKARKNLMNKASSRPPREKLNEAAFGASPREYPCPAYPDCQAPVKRERKRRRRRRRNMK